jgi:hypothetical protein
VMVKGLHAMSELYFGATQNENKSRMKGICKPSGDRTYVEGDKSICWEMGNPI